MNPNQSPLEVSVTDLDLFRHWSEEEGLDTGWLLTKLLVREQTDAMKAGSAFHKALENALEGDFTVVSADDYVFHFDCDMEIAMPSIREGSMSKDYHGLLVKGRVDGVHGRTITEIKTTEQFDPDRYLEGLQWKFYLDMTGCDRFDWHVFQVRECGDKEYDVFGYHQLTQYRFVGLHEMCERWTRDYKDFAERFLVPELEKQVVQK
jgi:hypothetical protein